VREAVELMLAESRAAARVTLTMRIMIREPLQLKAMWSGAP
jgi:hypothetical protein